METSELLSTESFSYSWLSNIRRPSLEGPNEPLKPSLGNSPATSFENPLEKSLSNFNFQVSISHSQASFVHADEIFSNGIIRPVSVDYPNHGTAPASETIPPKSSNSLVQRATFPHIQCRLCWRWRKSSKQILEKCISFIKSASCYSIKRCRRKKGNGSRTDVGADWRFQEIRSWNSSPQQSPPRTSHSISHWSDNENSIYEAVLHCKRSIGSSEDYETRRTGNRYFPLLFVS